MVSSFVSRGSSDLFAEEEQAAATLKSGNLSTDSPDLPTNPYPYLYPLTQKYQPRQMAPVKHEDSSIVIGGYTWRFPGGMPGAFEITQESTASDHQQFENKPTQEPAGSGSRRNPDAPNHFLVPNATFVSYLSYDSQQVASFCDQSTNQKYLFCYISVWEVPEAVPAETSTTNFPRQRGPGLREPIHDRRASARRTAQRTAEKHPACGQ